MRRCGDSLEGNNMEATERQRIVEAVTRKAEQIREEELIRRARDTAFQYWLDHCLFDRNDVETLHEMGMRL